MYFFIKALEQHHVSSWEFEHVYATKNICLCVFICCPSEAVGSSVRLMDVLISCLA